MTADTRVVVPAGTATAVAQLLPVYPDAQAHTPVASLQVPWEEQSSGHAFGEDTASVAQSDPVHPVVHEQAPEVAWQAPCPEHSEDAPGHILCEQSAPL